MDTPLVYISYALEDLGWEDRLAEHLRMLSVQLVGMELVSNGDGTSTAKRVEQDLEKARVAGLLISPAYLASERVQAEELPILLRNKDLRVLPILVSAISNRPGWLRSRPMLPRNGRALDSLTREEAEAELASIAREIADAALGGPAPSFPEEEASFQALPGSDVEPAVHIDWLNRLQRSPTVEGVLQKARDTALKGPVPIPISTSLLLFAFAELGQAVESRRAVDFLAFALDRAAYQSVRDEYLRTKRSGRSFPVRSGWVEEALTPEAWRTLERAAQLAATLSSTEEIHARHLLAALLEERPGARLTGAQNRLRDMGITPAELRRQLLAWIERHGPENRDDWLPLLAPELMVSAPDGGRGILPDEAAEKSLLPRSFLSAYAADDSRGDDLLGITKDVNACASLIAARTVAPPLSIGLFGDWGSGKTFFMRQLRRRVDRIAREARESGRMQKDIAYYKRIVQIEFNAWHYVEGNLWASLVEHIFANLQIAGEDTSTVEKLKQHYLEKLEIEETAQKAASAKEELAQAALTRAQTELNRAREEYDRKAEELAALSAHNVLVDLKASDKVREEVNDALEKLGLAPVGQAIRDVQQALSKARAVMNRGSRVLAPLVQSPDRSARYAALLVIVIGAPLLGWGVGLFLAWLGQDAQAQLGGLASGAAALLGTGAAWVRRQTEWASKRVSQLEAAREALDREVAEAQAENVRRIKELEQRLELLRTDYAAAQRKSEEARLRVAEAQAELKQATVGKLLAHFIQDRAQSTDYRKHLGVLALVRDDFERLSDLIEEENWRLAPSTPQDGDRRHAHPKYDSLEKEDAERETRINRIVLYIDDLDRCPPPKVVEVLQAVHLLLAFPLFVVVVGVDARWVARSLQKHYPDLLQEDQSREGKQGQAAASPDDYLEKIFQIPFWLRPMREDSCLQMVQGLLAPSLAPDEVKEEEAEPVTGAGGAVVPTSDPKPDLLSPGGEAGDRLPPAAPPQPPGQPSRPPVEDKILASVITEPKIDLSPGSLVIHQAEKEFIESLAPILSRSPRALKRFVNVYQLIKAGLSEEEQASLLEQAPEETPKYQALLFLLAVVTGAPDVAPEFWRVLRQADREKRTPQQEGVGTRAGRRLDWLIGKMDKALGQEHPDWRRVRDWIWPRRLLLRLDLDLDPLIEWEAEVSRYSFRVAPEEEPFAVRPGASPPPAPT